MNVRFSGDGPPDRTTRLVNLVVGLLYLVVAGMVVFFRLVSFARVEERLKAQGAEFPAWFDLLFTVGPLLVAVFLVVKGVGFLRRSRGPSRPQPPV